MAGEPSGQQPASIGGDTVIQLTMKQLIWGIGVVLVGGAGLAWLVFGQITSGVREDVGAIRQSIQALQTGEKDGIRRVGETDTKLSTAIAELRVAIQGLDGRIAAFDGKLDMLNKSMSTVLVDLTNMQKQLAARQAALNDPKNFDAFATKLSNLKFSDKNVVVVPYEPYFTPQPR
jgi:hypothetical protein